MNTTGAAWTGIQRPQRADARRNFDALLASAREAFGEKGTSASLEDIARRADVGIGTVYRHFPTRESLIEAVYVVEVERVVRAATTVAGLEPWSGFRAWLDTFLVYIGTKHALIDALNRESAVLQHARAALYAAGEPLLRQAQATGEVRSDVTIDDVLSMLSGIVGVAFPDPAQRERVLAIAFDGLRVR